MRVFTRPRRSLCTQQPGQICYGQTTGKYLKLALLLTACGAYLFAQKKVLSKDYSRITTIASHSYSASGNAEDYYAAELYSSSIVVNTTHEIATIIPTEEQTSVSRTSNLTADISVNQPTTKKPLFCTREQIRRGHWKAVQHEKAPYLPDDTWESAWESTCYLKDGPREGQLEESPFQDWAWAADNDPNEDNDCLFAPFDVKRFCQLNANRTIAFLGDSITWQQLNSLNHLIGATDDLRGPFRIETRACNESTKLAWLRDNYASAWSLDDIIKRYDPDVIVFNRGAHFINNTILAKELNATLARALEWQHDCDERKRDCLLVWRTTAPGFPNCDQIPGPISLSNRSMAEDLISNQSNAWYNEKPIQLENEKPKPAVRKDFHWWDFADQNVMVEALFQYQMEDHPQLRISFIDFYDMAILRPDSHIGQDDCLHWCLPGPLDAVNAVLLHEMEMAAATAAASLLSSVNNLLTIN